MIFSPCHIQMEAKDSSQWGDESFIDDGQKICRTTRRKTRDFEQQWLGFKNKTKKQALKSL